MARFFQRTVVPGATLRIRVTGRGRWRCRCRSKGHRGKGWSLRWERGWDNLPGEKDRSRRLFSLRRHRGGEGGRRWFRGARLQRNVCF